MKKQIIFLLLVVFALTNCKPSAPDRLRGIPEKTFWVGENSIGHWFLVDSINKTAGTIHFKIYNDKTGKLVSNRKFKLHCYLCADKINLDNLKDEIRYYDEVPYNYENYIMLKTKDADNKYSYFK